MKTKLWIVFIVVVSILISGVGLSLAQEAEQASEAEENIINVNFASQEELETLPGMGEDLVQAIIEERPYGTWEDLQKIEGIGATLEDIEEMIEVKKINVNMATPEKLMLLPGMSLEIAEAIIEERTYAEVEDLKDVEGIDDEIFEKISGYVVTKKQRDTRGRKNRSRKGGGRTIPSNP